MNENRFTKLVGCLSSNYEWPKVDHELLERVVSHSNIVCKKGICKHFDGFISNAYDITGGLFDENDVLMYSHESGKFGYCEFKRYPKWMDECLLGFIPNPIHIDSLSETSLVDGSIRDSDIKSWRYIVLKFSLEKESDRYSIIGHLAKIAPLTLINRSSSTSFEAWFYAEGQPEQDLLKFIILGAKLGADCELLNPTAYVNWPLSNDSGIEESDLIFYRNPSNPATSWKFHKIPTCCEPNTSRIELHHHSELVNTDGANELVEGFLIAGQSSIFYGASNVGKSFLALDLCAHIATGTMWRSKKVKQGGVLFLSLEGDSGLKRRLQAMNQSGLLTPEAPLIFHTMQVDFRDEYSSIKIIEAIERLNQNNDCDIVYVVVDTLSRAIAGGDENNGATMTKYIATIDAIISATGVHVTSIHHSGKDSSRGARGHTSLPAAVDTLVAISRAKDGELVSAKVIKQRDLKSGAIYKYKLAQVTLDVGAQEQEKTSCVIAHIEDGEKVHESRINSKAPKELLQVLPQLNISSWVDAVKDQLGISRSTFYTLKKMLNEGEHYRKTDHGIDRCD